MTIEIADRLVKLRKKYGYSQEELADKLGLSRQAVSKWERAEASPDTDNLICLAKLYGVSLDELLALRQLQQPEDSVHLRAGRGAEVPQPHLRPFARPYRPARRGEAPQQRRTPDESEGGKQLRCTRAGGAGPQHPGRTVPRLPRHPLQRTGQHETVPPVLRHRRGMQGADEAGDGPARPLRPCLRPHPQGGPHHRRPQCQSQHHCRAPVGGHQFPKPRPGQLGEVIMHKSQIRNPSLA